MKKYLVGIVLVVSLTLGSIACNWQGTVSAILADLPSIAQAVIAILEVSGVAVPLNAEAKIQKDSTAAVNIVKSTSSVAGATSICEARVAVNLVEGDMNDLFTLSNVNNPTSQAKITQIASVVVAGADTVFSLIPAAQGCPVSAAKFESKFRTSNKIYKSKRQFVSDFNSALTSKTGDTALDAVTVKHKLHKPLF